MSFGTEVVTEKVNNIMKALDIDKARGTAPPGAAEDTLAKYLQAMQIQATKKTYKKKKNDSKQASPQKEDAKPSKNPGSDEENPWAGLAP